jgi:uncharacterized protein
MQIWLDQVREEPFNWDEIESVTPESLECPELVGLGPVSWRGQVVFADPGYLLRARLSYEQTLSCNRCLKPIVEHAESQVELMIVVERRHDSGGERELTEKELGILFLDEEILRTEPILIEQIQLNVPMKPLCQPECRGLCPVCGTDWNEGACSCAGSEPDARWAALAALKGRLGDEKK